MVSSLLSLTGTLVRAIEAADADEKTRKKNDNANAELGTVAAESLLNVVPQIEALQKTLAEANAQANTLVGTSAGMASRLARATAKKAITEDK